MRPSLRNRVQFLQQNRIEANDAAILEADGIQNIIWKTDEPDKKWIEESTENVGDWRSFSRSVYMRWAITINALHIARDRYATNSNIALSVDSIRPTPRGPDRVHLAVWPAEEAAENYNNTIPLLSAYGVQDLYGALEEIIFSLYEIFVRGNPHTLMEGPEFKPLRKLFREKDENDAAKTQWNSAWERRVDNWRRNKTYDGLHRVFAAFWSAAELKRPSWFERSDIDDWCKAIETIALIRHHITHGKNEASERLAELCNEQPHLGLKFEAGTALNVSLTDLMIVEEFIDKIITTINGSLVEKAHGGPLPRPSAREEG